MRFASSPHPTALELFDSEQLGTLLEEGRGLVEELESGGRLSSAVRERLTRIEAAARGEN